MTVILIDSSVLFAMIGSKSIVTVGPVIDFFLLPLLIGSLISIFGSVLPDIDGKGNIRWIIGPVVGSFAFFPPFLTELKNGGLWGGIRFVGEGGSALFLVSTLFGYLFLLIPMKHRGMMHDPRMAGMFGAVVFTYLSVMSPLTILQSLLVGILALMGYLWHLALDGKLI